MKLLFCLLIVISSTAFSQGKDTIVIMSKSDLINLSIIIDRNPTAKTFIMDNLFTGYIPEEIVRLNSLTSISVVNNDLENLPDFICSFNHLERLNLGSNKLYNEDDLFIKLSRCHYLDSLILYRNNIDSVSISIKKMKRLKYLDLSYNLIKTLPLELSELSNIEYMDISHNPIDPEIILSILSKLPNLIKLNLSECKILSIPEVLFKITSIRELILSNNLIQTINENIKTLNKLEYLNLSGNLLCKITTDLPQSLKYLILAGNRLSPEDLTHLKEAVPQAMIIQ